MGRRALFADKWMHMRDIRIYVLDISCVVRISGSICGISGLKVRIYEIRLIFSNDNLVFR